MAVTFTNEMSVVYNQSALAFQGSLGQGFQNSEFDFVAAKHPKQVEDFIGRCKKGQIRGGDIARYELLERRPRFLFLGVGYRAALNVEEGLGTLADAKWPHLFLKNLSLMLVRERVSSCGLLGQFEAFDDVERQRFKKLLMSQFKNHRCHLVAYDVANTLNNDPRMNDYFGYQPFDQAM